MKRPAVTWLATTCEVSDLSDNTKYYFVVRAYNEHGESGNSNEVSFPGPPISLSTASLSNTSTAGSNARSQTFTLGNADANTFSYTISISNSANWLSCSPSSGICEGGSDAITVNYASSNLAPGEYTATISVNAAGATNSPQEVSVGLTVNGSPSEPLPEPNPDPTPKLAPTISSSTDSLNNSCAEGINAPSQSFTIGNAGEGTLSYSIADDATWLACTPKSGSSMGEQDSITVNYATSELTPGVYTATITLSASGASNSPQQIMVRLNIPQFNLPPLKPVIVSPYNREMQCEPNLRISAEPFADPDEGDHHSKSRWLIRNKADSSLVLDIMSTENLTVLPVPHLVLEHNKTYSLQVQFYDSYSEATEWSEPVEFTTKLDQIDQNLDGIPDSLEVDELVDLNKDGITDNDIVPQFKCIRSQVDPTIIGIRKQSEIYQGNEQQMDNASCTSTIEMLNLIDPATVAEVINRPSSLPFGLFSYRLRVSEPGAAAKVTIYFSEDISQAYSLYKYDTVNGWHDYSEYTTFNADGRSVTLEVKDGGYGDSDGVANGVIVDPVGLATTDDGGTGPDIGGLGSTLEDIGIDSAGGGGCFIATAAFGSYVEPHVKLLRQFRDQYLLTNEPGRHFVKMYYQYGPSAASVINVHKWLKPFVRLALMPLVGVSYMLMKTSAVTKVLLKLLLMVSVLIPLKTIRRNWLSCGS